MPETPNPNPPALDASSFPHIITQIIASAPRESLHKLRLTCHALRQMADEELVQRHIVIGHPPPNAIGPVGVPTLWDVYGSPPSSSRGDDAGVGGAVWAYGLPGVLLDVSETPSSNENQTRRHNVQQTRVISYAVDFTKYPYVDCRHFEPDIPAEDDLAHRVWDSVYFHPHTNLLGLPLMENTPFPNLEVVRAISPTFAVPKGMPARTFIKFSHMAVMRSTPMPPAESYPRYCLPVEREYDACLRRPFWDVSDVNGAERCVVNLRIPAEHGAWEVDAHIGASHFYHGENLTEAVWLFTIAGGAEPFRVPDVPQLGQRYLDPHGYFRPLYRPELPDPNLRCGIAYSLLDTVAYGLAAKDRARFTLVGLDELVHHVPRVLGFHPPMTFGSSQIQERFMSAVEYYLRVGYDQIVFSTPVPDVDPEDIPELLTKVKFVSHDEYRSSVDPEQYVLETVE